MSTVGTGWTQNDKGTETDDNINQQASDTSPVTYPTCELRGFWWVLETDQQVTKVTLVDGSSWTAGLENNEIKVIPVALGMTLFIS